MKPRTKLALIQNAFIGVPVIIAISLFNGIFATASAVDHALGSAIVGFCVSFLMLYVSLSAFGIRSKYDMPREELATSELKTAS